MRTIRIIVLAVLTIAMIGCSSTPDSGDSAAGQYVKADGTIVVEVEGFKLTDAEVKELASAAGGKTVVLKGDNSKVEGTVNLKKGEYVVILYAMGPSQDEDACYMTIGAGAEERVYPEDVEAVLPTMEVYHTQKEDGPCSILITFAEENVHLDRVEFKLTPP